MRALLAALILIAGCASAQAAPWRITKDHWDARDEAGYGAFITAVSAILGGKLRDEDEDRWLLANQ